MPNSNADLLHPSILKWLGRMGWTSLHEIQEQAIKPVLEGKDDVIISAATASGKTEAAFLPAVSRMITHQNKGVGIIYISPLKALINDQYKRVKDLGDNTGIKVTPWHGDIGENQKKGVLQNPSGIILITPESLESLLINRNEWCRKNLTTLDCFIIDEFHAFIGTERGCQLLSQMHRLESILHRRIQRIALSATLSNIQSVKQWLRPNSEQKIKIIENSTGKSGIKLQIRGYDIPHTESDIDVLKDYDIIAGDLFRMLRGSTNLVFVNSRSKAEYLAGVLLRFTEENNLPLEFFPHYSSLGKDMRERLENRLKEGRLPTTAICTQTLELGIDIGDISSIAQINAPQSVASLRQRIGRSGRRGADAVLRLFIPETTLSASSKTSISEKLRDQTFLSTAMIELVLSRWFEPPTLQNYAMSTLVQQILSTIAQYGNAQAISLWKLLCSTGTFNLVNQKIFSEILRSLAKHDLITQMRDKSLTLGVHGEKIVSNYNFYSAFKAQEEFTIDNAGHKIGTIPLNQPLSVGDTFLFAGKGWEVIFFNSENHQIFVKPYKQDTEPLIMDGGSGRIHDGIREKMFELYKSADIPTFLNKNAAKHFEEGRSVFRALHLDENRYIIGLEGIYLFPWKGDRIMHTIVQMLKENNINAKKVGSSILLPKLSSLVFKDTVKEILDKDAPGETELAKTVSNLEYEKFDQFLSKELLQIGYGYRNFDVPGAMNFFKEVLQSCTPYDKETGAAYMA